MNEDFFIYDKLPFYFAVEADRILEEFDDLANELNITHFLWRGTLLGFYRDGTYPDTDIDIDVGIICPPEKMDVLFEKLQEKGYTAKTPLELENLRPKCHNRQFIKNGLTLDIYFVFLSRDLEFLNTFKELEYHGRRYLIPSDVEKMLDTYYPASGDHGHWKIKSPYPIFGLFIDKERTSKEEAVYLISGEMKSIKIGDIPKLGVIGEQSLLFLSKGGTITKLKKMDISNEDMNEWVHKQYKKVVEKQ